MLKVNLCTFWLQFFIYALFCGHGQKTHNFCLMCFDASKLPFGLQTWFVLLCFVLRFCVLDLVLFYLIGMYSFVSLVWYVQSKSCVYAFFVLDSLLDSVWFSRFEWLVCSCQVWFSKFCPQCLVYHVWFKGRCVTVGVV